MKAQQIQRFAGDKKMLGGTARRPGCYSVADFQQPRPVAVGAHVAEHQAEPVQIVGQGSRPGARRLPGDEFLDDADVDPLAGRAT
jgi:hypothetical protein